MTMLEKEYIVCVYIYIYIYIILYYIILYYIILCSYIDRYTTRLWEIFPSLLWVYWRRKPIWALAISGVAVRSIKGFQISTRPESCADFIWLDGRTRFGWHLHLTYIKNHSDTLTVSSTVLLRDISMEVFCSCLTQVPGADEQSASARCPWQEKFGWGTWW